MPTQKPKTQLRLKSTREVNAAHTPTRPHAERTQSAKHR